MSFFCKKNSKKLWGGEIFLLPLHAENFKKLSFMKKYLLTLLSIIFSITLMGQTVFTDTSLRLTYTVIDESNHYVEVKKQENEFNNNQVKTVNIPATVTYNSQEYTVTKIADSAFQNSNDLKEVIIPNTVTEVGKNAFQSCGKLEEVDLGEGVTAIGNHAFQGCHNLHSILLPPGLTRIENSTFENCHGLNEIIIPSGVTYIGEYAFHNVHSIEVIFLGSGNIDIAIVNSAFTNCSNVHVTCMNTEALTFNGTNSNGQSDVSIFGNNASIHIPCGSSNIYYTSTNNGTQIDETDCVRTTRQSGLFCEPSTWIGYDSWSEKEAYEALAENARETWLETHGYPNFMPRDPNHHFHIRKNHIVRLTHERNIYPFNSINEGVLRIEGAGQLVERDTIIVDDGWRPDATILGEDNAHTSGADMVYMNENLGGIIEIVAPADSGKWNFIGAPFNGYDLWAVKIGPNNHDVTVVEFDYNNGFWSNNFSTVDSIIEPGEGFLAWPFYKGGVVFSTKRDFGDQAIFAQTRIMEADFGLNHEDVVVTKTITSTQGENQGNWLALANPYPAKLCVNDFITENHNQSQQIQGEGVYVHDAESNSFSFKAKGIGYDLGVCQGFFVNFATSGEKTIGFRKNQLHGYDEPTHTLINKSTTKPKKEFIRLSMFEGEKESELLFAYNEESEQGYDIFDANKLFSMEKITEPYFVTEGVALVKEEVKHLPYYAQMNVRSFEDKEVTFRLKDIPEDLVVFLIDNGKATRMNGGVEYRTKITAGENANRFQLLVKKASTIEDAKDNNIEISNSNRFVSISSTQTDLQIEVYNALGQKILTTNNYNFNLNEASAGAYIVKAYNKAASKTHKIVIK